MAAMDDQSSPRSSQSSLSGLPSDDDEVEMHTRAKARRLAAEEDEEDDEDEVADSDEEQEAAANGSASEEDEEAMGAEEEEADELDDDDDDDDDSEAEELEEGDGDDYETEEANTKQQTAAKTRKPPVRIASNTTRKRKAIAELSRSGSEDSSPALRVPAASSTKGGTSRKITLRISPSKNGKGKKAATAAKEKKRQPRQSKAATTIAAATKQQQKVTYDDDEEEEDEIEDDEEEGQGDGAEGEQDSWDDDDFENDQSFAQLPKTARQLAKERANQGADSGSELQELPIEESKKSKLTESEIALRKSEMSRRRRNQTEKKLEDDKIETINRLLKKQVTRRSNREKAGAEDSEADMEEDKATGTVEKKVVDPRQVRLELKQAPRPFFRYIQSTQGSTLSLPIEEVGDDQPYRNKWEAIFSKQAAV